jgi:hypothetical protein
MSPRTRAVDDARQQASKQGHDLARSTEVEVGGIARIRCTRCNRSAFVMLYEPWTAQGAAVDDACNEGNQPEPLPEPKPKLPPNDGQAKAIPGTVPLFGRRKEMVPA